MRLLTSDQMKKVKADPQLKEKIKVSDAAITKFDTDLPLIKGGQLASPSSEYQFVWNPGTGERFLFKGQVDPL